jgi:hypothetical protein
VNVLKPLIMHDAMDLAGSSTDEMLRNGTLGMVQTCNKRNWDNNKQGSSGNNSYRKPTNAVKNYATTVPERALYVGTLLK